MKSNVIVVGGKSYIKAKVVRINTKDKTGLRTQKGRVFLSKPTMGCFGARHNHLHFLPDEEIKVGDWFLTFEGTGEVNDLLGARQCEMESNIAPELFKKIIASTDESLKFGEDCKPFVKFKSLPRPSNEFLQAYCKVNGKIEEVLIEVELIHIHSSFPKQLQLKTAPDNTITIKRTIDQLNEIWGDDEDGKYEELYQHHKKKVEQEVDVDKYPKEIYPKDWIEYWQYKKPLKDIGNFGDKLFKENNYANKTTMNIMGAFKIGVNYGIKEAEERLIPIIQKALQDSGKKVEGKMYSREEVLAIIWKLYEEIDSPMVASDKWIEENL